MPHSPKDPAVAGPEADARDLQTRPDSYTSIPQYYPGRKPSKSDHDAAAPPAYGATADDAASSGDAPASPSGKTPSSPSRSSFSGAPAAGGPTARPAARRDRHGHLLAYDAPHAVTDPSDPNYDAERAPLLDPSDPHVTPLNLRGVRVLHSALYLQLAVGALWTLVLFVNTFVSLPIPGVVPLRDSGFAELVLAAVACVATGLALAFFETPSGADRRAASVATAGLALALLLTAAAPKLRHRAGVPGIVVLAWATVAVALAGVVTPAVVQWGKVHEEVRLTGRRETRRTIGEWFKVWTSFVLTTAAVVIPCVLFFLAVLLDLYDSVSLRKDFDTGHFVSIYPNGGDSTTDALGTSDWASVSRVGSGHGDTGYKNATTRGDGHHYRVFVYCTPRQGGPDPATGPGGGNGAPPQPPSIRPGPDGRPAPIVLVEGDVHTSAQTFVDGWLDELYNQNKIAQLCYWNRPGRGYSDNAPSPFSPGMAADALAAALAHVLKPHSHNGDDEYLADSTSSPFGNLTFAVVGHGLGGIYSRVFAARHTASIHSLTLIDAYPEQLLVRRLGRATRGFWHWADGVASVFGARRQLSWLLRGRSARDRTFGKMAAATRPSELKASLQEQIAALGLMRNDLEAADSVLSGSSLPLAVLSSAQRVREDAEWSNYQRALTKVTANNVAWEVLEGPHDLWLTSAAKRKMQSILVNLLAERRDPEEY